MAEERKEIIRTSPLKPIDVLDHSCQHRDFWVIRTLRNRARVLVWECGHLQLRQKDEVLPGAPLDRPYEG